MNKLTENYQIETAEEALASILSDMNQAVNSRIDILAEPEVDPSVVPVIRDADELETEEIIELDASDLEEIVDNIPATQPNSVPTYQIPHGSYAPRHAMVLMAEQDANSAKAIGTALAKTGIPVSYKTSDLGAIVYLNQSVVDVIVIGPEFNNVARYVENHDSRKGSLTIGVTSNGMPVDIKVENTKDLVQWAQKGGIVKAYTENEDAQKYRTRVEAEAPHMLAYMQSGKTK